MNTELLNSLNDYILVRLTEKRYKHTLSVVETALALAEKYGEDKEKTHIAAFFHDACKNLDIEEMNMLVEKYEIGEVYIDKPQLAHSKLAAAILSDKFGIDDEDIINAVSYHTTGRAGMSLFEEVIFVADAVDETRNYQEVQYYRDLAFEDIDRACLEIMDFNIEHVKSKGKVLDEDTLSAREYIIDKIRSRET